MDPCYVDGLKILCYKHDLDLSLIWVDLTACAVAALCKIIAKLNFFCCIVFPHILVLISVVDTLRKCAIKDFIPHSTYYIQSCPSVTVQCS